MVVEPNHGGRDPHQWEDVELLAGIREGNEAAFVALVERYHCSLIRLASSFVGDPAVAEDVAQEAWLGLLEGLPRFAGKASVRTWLFHILVNCARARWRHEHRSVPFSDAGLDGDDRPSVDPARFLPPGQRWSGHWADPPVAWPEEHALESEIRDVLEGVVATLPAHQRAVLTLRDIEGWSCPEVCAILGISEGNQRVLLHRARTSIRAELERYFADSVEGAGS